jgi:hypothetical protein
VADKVVILDATDSSPWTVPADFPSGSNNTVEAWGGGSDGQNGNPASGGNGGNGGRGGAGGA